jgi:hypothetical protein
MFTRRSPACAQACFPESGNGISDSKIAQHSLDVLVEDHEKPDCLAQVGHTRQSSIASKEENELREDVNDGAG